MDVKYDFVRHINKLGASVKDHGRQIRYSLTGLKYGI